MLKYIVEYESKAGPDAVIDGTVIADLKGWSMQNSFDLSARDDAEAVRMIKTWYFEFLDRFLAGQHRILVGEPRLLKVTTLDWKG